MRISIGPLRVYLLALIFVLASHDCFAQPAANAPAAKVDRYGDPLPAGAVMRLGTVRLRQCQMVEGVAFSPDGKMLASCAWDQWIRVWDVASGRELHHFPGGDQNGSFSVVFSPDGTRLVGVSESGFVSVWDTTTWKLLSNLRSHDRQRTYGIAFAPDGVVFATAGGDGRVRVWDVPTGRELLALAMSGRPPGDTCPVAFSPDGTRLASANGEDLVFVWDLASGGQPLVIPTPHQRGATSVAFSADGSELFTGGSRTERTPQRTSRSIAEIYAWNVTDGKPKATFEFGEEVLGICAFALSADRATLVSAHRDRLIVWDVASRRPRRVIRGPNSRSGIRSHGVAVSPDGRQIAATVGDLGQNKIYMWDATTGDALHAQEDSHGEGVLAISTSPDGKWIATGSADHSVRLWNAATGEHVRKIDVGTGWARYVEFFPDGERLVLGRETHGTGQPSFQGEIKICRVADGEVLHQLAMPDRVMCGSLSADGKLLAVGIGLYGPFGARGEGGGGCQIIVFDAESGRQIAQIKGATSQYVQLAFSPRGDELWSMTEDRSVRKWNPRDGEEIPLDPAAAAIETGSFGPQAVFLPKAAAVVSSRLDGNRGEQSRGTLTLYPANSPTARWQKDLGDRWAMQVGASPDGRFLVTQRRSVFGAPLANSISLWSAEDGRELVSFDTESDYARSFTFSRDGRLLISGMELGDTLVWDISAFTGGK